MQSMMKNKCGQCNNCKRANCGSCSSCQDMPRFGGPGKMKQACNLRKCLASVYTVSNTSFASVSAVGQSSSSLLNVTVAPPNTKKRIMDSFSSNLEYPGPSKAGKKTVSFHSPLPSNSPSPCSSTSSLLGSGSTPFVPPPLSPIQSSSSLLEEGSSLTLDVIHEVPEDGEMLERAELTSLAEKPAEVLATTRPRVNSNPVTNPGEGSSSSESPSTSSNSSSTTWTPTFVDGRKKQDGSGFTQILVDPNGYQMKYAKNNT